MRYVKPKDVWRDDDGSILGVFPTAFELRSGEDYLSAAWLEYYAPQSRADQVKATIAAFNAALSVGKTAAFTMGNVAKVKAVCASFNRPVRVLHEPDLPHLPSHVAVRRYTDENAELRALLAASTWCDVVPA